MGHEWGSSRDPGFLRVKGELTTADVEEMALPPAAAPLRKQVPLLVLSAEGSGTCSHKPARPALPQL